MPLPPEDGFVPDTVEATAPPARWLVWRARLLPLARRLWPSALVLISALGGMALYEALFPPPAPLGISQVDERIDGALAEVTPAPPYSASVYQVILPSLVFIQTERAATEEREEGEGSFGIGTGVVINENGEVLTAHHVISGALKIDLHFADGSRAAAVIVSAEPENDIAVLAPLEPPGLIVPAVLGNPGALRVGDEAFAVGNPLGLAASLSAGVISGFDRSIPIKGSDQRLEGLIQFDTAVNPGNSGGPLLNRAGQVVGIVTALANPSQQNFFVGIGFAVPIGTAVAAGGGGPQY